MVYPAEIHLMMVLETGKSKNMVLVTGFLARDHFFSLKSVVFFLSIHGSETGTHVVQIGKHIPASLFLLI